MNFRKKQEKLLQNTLFREFFTKKSPHDFPRCTKTTESVFPGGVDACITCLVRKEQTFWPVCKPNEMVDFTLCVLVLENES